MAGVEIEKTWKEALTPTFDQPYFKNVVTFLKTEKQKGKRIYPPGNQIFEAFNSASIHDVKVVIIGQDPYHGEGQANGLCFSVNKSIPIPPSLQNIYKELAADLKLPIPEHGNLSGWARQGVFLLNATLTVEANKAGSHQHKGWEEFTDEVIKILSRKNSNLVFMLWGGFAKKKKKIIDANKHLILESGHPSPLSANRGYWFGNKHFSLCNAYLARHNKKTIDWKV